jgi:hypothetical protein
MKTVDTPLIMSFRPCPDWPESRVREAVPKEITIVDLLRADHIPPEDRLWVALHECFCSTSLMRLFSCDCAERALISEREAGRDPDPRSWDAVAVARRYTRGEATGAELDDAMSAARFAARFAALDDAMSAAWLTAWYAANASFAADLAAERRWQCEHLAEMLEEER